MASNGAAWERFAALTPAEFGAALDEVTLRMRNLLCAKRASYGPTNLAKFGDAGVLVRTSDKLERLVHMRGEGLTTTPVGEDARDAWMDIAGYALLVLTAHSLSEEPDATVHDDDQSIPVSQDWPSEASRS